MSRDDQGNQLGLSQLLARLSASRDAQAWAGLLHLVGPEIARLARRITGDAVLADDVLQEALLEVRDSAGRFRPRDDPDSDARRWIMRLTANTALRMMRTKTRARHRERRHADGRAAEGSPESSLESAEESQLLRQAMAQLPERHGAAIVLHHVAGLTFEEVAAELDLPIGTAKTWVRRGLLELRQRLEGMGVAMSVATLSDQLANLPIPEGGAPISAFASVLHSPAIAVIPKTVVGKGMLWMSLMAFGIGVVMTALVLARQRGDILVPTRDAHSARLGLYEVGPGCAYADPSAVPWHALRAGDTVLIHQRDEPYRCRWSLDVAGTEAAPITVRGVAGDASRGKASLPVITGEDALPPLLAAEAEAPRAIVTVGSAARASWIVIENLEVRSARPGFMYRDAHGAKSWSANAAAILLERGSHLTVRACRLHDCAQGFSALSGTAAIEIDGCEMWDNGEIGSSHQTNSDCACDGILYQRNRFGPLRAGCGGDNLCDRSAGCVIRWNWIEGGNRQIDLVEAQELSGLPGYREARVYGNVLIERAGPDAGNSIMVNYGGEGADLKAFRQGILWFHHNTVISERPDFAALLEISNPAARCEAWDDIFWTPMDGSTLSLVVGPGQLHVARTWIKTGWLKTREPGEAPLSIDGLLDGDDPGFVDARARDYHLADGSACIGVGAAPSASPSPADPLDREYDAPGRDEARAPGGRDLGAFGQRSSR